MKNIYSFLIASSLAMPCHVVFAQNDTTLQQSMVVERDFSPIVRDANKIDQQPKQEEIKVRKSATRYADWLAPTASSSAIGQMPAGQVVAVEDPLNNGFIEFSAGNYVNADLKAGVSYNDLSAEVSGFATKGDLDLPFVPYGNDDKTKWESRMLNGDIKLGYDHTFANSSRVRAYIGAGGRSYNMMCAEYKPSEKYKPEVSDNYDLVYFHESSSPAKQKAGRVGAGVIYDVDDLSLQLQYNHDGEKLFKTSENSIKLAGKYGWYYDADWQLTATLNIGLQFGEETTFTFMPGVEYSHFGASTLSRFYANVKTGLSRYELYDVVKAMPMSFNVWDYGKETNLFDATIGYENNDNGMFHYGVFAGAALTLDRLDAEMTSSMYGIEDAEGKHLEMSADRYPKTFAKLFNHDAFEFKAGAYMDYEYNKYFKAKAGVKFNSNPRFADSKFKLNLNILSNPVSRLTLDLGFNGGFGREMTFCESYSPNGNDESVWYKYDIDLDNILDLSFRADYRLMENLNVFLYGNNLLNKEYQLWAAIPAQKINIHAGFNWRF